MHLVVCVCAYVHDENFLVLAYEESLVNCGCYSHFVSV